MPQKIACAWNGKQYESIQDAADATGYLYSTLYTYLRKGFTCDAEVVTQKAPIPFDGYPSLSAYGRAHGISHQGAYARFKKRHEVASSKPAKKARIYKKGASRTVQPIKKSFTIDDFAAGLQRPE